MEEKNNYKGIKVILAILVLFLAFQAGSLFVDAGNEPLFVSDSNMHLIKKSTRLPDSMYISIHKYNEILAYNKYARAINRAETYMMYQRHHGQDIDSTFASMVKNHIYTPSEVANEEYIDWNRATTNEPPIKLAIDMNLAAANWYEAICFSQIDVEHDSAWVLQSDTYKSIIDLIKKLRN